MPRFFPIWGSIMGYPSSIKNNTNALFLFALDTSDRQARSASLSSDDVMGLSQSQQTLSRSSTLPYDHIPQRAQPQRGVGPRPKTRPSSPGSEMVTLEEFLQESNIQSPPVVILHTSLLHFAFLFCFISPPTHPQGQGVGYKHKKNP